MNDPQLTLSRQHIDAVLFDLDGVVTRTADIHAAAWKQLFDDYLSTREAQSGEDHSPFDLQHDYRQYVDGRPRISGVETFLSARGIQLPEGDSDDPPDRETLNGLGNRKNQMFRDMLRQHGVKVYDCAIALAHRLRQAGFGTAVVTASKNCGLILEQAGLDELFDVRVDGVVAAELGLPGKPEPDTFVEAARRLGVEPGRAAVLEDAVAGVAAASRGQFGLSIGVDRGGQREALYEHGADLVFADLCHIRVESDQTTEPPLLTDMTEVSARLTDKRPALFLDYDGTLTPIVERPQDARLSESMRRALREAAEVISTAIVSGRDLEDVRDLVGLSEMIYAGSHGFDIRGPNLRFELPEGVDALDDLQQAAEALNDLLGSVAGARVERKRFAVAVHFRQVADADLDKVDEAMQQVQHQVPDLRRTGGKKIYELRPDIDWDKGRAVRWLLDKLDLASPDVLPIYIGDDETDEDAFRALADRDGIGILVAEESQPSAATYRLRTSDDVETFLRHLTEAERAGD